MSQVGCLSRKILRARLIRGEVHLQDVVPRCRMKVRNCHEPALYEVVGVDLVEGAMRLRRVDDEGAEGSRPDRTVPIDPTWMVIELIDADGPQAGIDRSARLPR